MTSNSTPGPTNAWSPSLSVAVSSTNFRYTSALEQDTGAEFYALGVINDATCADGSLCADARPACGEQMRTQPCACKRPERPRFLQPMHQTTYGFSPMTSSWWARCFPMPGKHNVSLSNARSKLTGAHGCR